MVYSEACLNWSPMGQNFDAFICRQLYITQINTMCVNNEFEGFSGIYRSPYYLVTLLDRFTVQPYYKSDEQ